MAKPEAFGKTTPYATCPICHDIMLTEEYDGHMKNSHNQEQRDRFGIKIEEKPGPKGHFYGDVWTNFGRYGKNEQQPYQFTQAEFDAITRDAWEQNCEECRGIIENTEMNGSEYAIHPTPEQKTHMTDLFGYEAEPTPKSTGYLDPEDPAWQKSVEHIQKRYKGAPVGTFGPQSAMPRGEPTKNEWQIASYLDSIGVEYVHKMKLGELDPDTEKPKIEYDFCIPKLLIGIETSPSWHEGGPSEIQRVAENDKFKRQFAKENGITLFVYDPDEKFGGAEFINQVLAPELRTQGVDAPDVPTGEIPVPSEKEEDLSTKGRTYGDPRFNEWDTATIYREEEFCGFAWRAGEGNEPSITIEDAEMLHQREGYYGWWHGCFLNEGHPEDHECRCGATHFNAFPRLRQRMEETKGPGYDWDYSTKYRDKPILEEQGEPIGDSWKVKGKHNVCRKCGKETELCDICDYHHHVDNFMGEHEKFQMIVDSGGLEWDKLPPELQEFETKYGTAFPCPMDIDPEDMGTFKKEEQTDIPEGVVPPEGYAKQTTEEAAMSVLDHLIKGGVESFESWDEVIEHLQFLVDTGYIGNFQPPNISEEEFEVWKPLIQGMMRQQTRWPDLREQSGINQNIPTGAYERLEPLTLDQSQNVPRFPERGKVNTIEQQSGGEEMAAENHLFQEQDVNLQSLVEEFSKETGLTPYQICDGQCEEFASFVQKRIPEAEMVGPEIFPEGSEEFDFLWGHTFLQIGDKYYDAEAPQGVDHPIDLPLYKRRIATEKEEGRWDRPAPDTPEDEAMRKAYGELADETGDNVLQLVQDGTITPEAGDVLMEYQTKAKEAVMVGHFVEAHELLEKMAAYLLSAIPGLSD